MAALSERLLVVPIKLFFYTGTEIIPVRVEFILSTLLIKSNQFTNDDFTKRKLRLYGTVIRHINKIVVMATKKKAAKKSTVKKGTKKKNKLGVKNSLVNNINARKKKGVSRSKKKSTVARKQYKKMQDNWE
jgi:hypothetical protein